MEYSFFCDKCGQTCGRTRFGADFEQKNSGRFRGGASTQNPEKARKIKKIRRFVMNLRTGLSDKT
jgi:hypothetical protein